VTLDAMGNMPMDVKRLKSFLIKLPNQNQKVIKN
ncbi:MAG: hypothetical protein ACI8ZZ_002228, partial [Gammaproteobacteria bacterium]